MTRLLIGCALIAISACGADDGRDAANCGEGTALTADGRCVAVTDNAVTGDDAGPSAGDAGAAGDSAVTSDAGAAGDASAPSLDGGQSGDAGVVEPPCDADCVNGCWTGTSDCYCDYAACDNGCDALGACRPSLRGMWEVFRTATRVQGDCGSSTYVGEVLRVDWNCVNSGDWDQPIQCSVSGQTSYNPLRFSETYPDAVGGASLASGSRMDLTLTLLGSGNSFTGNETVAADGCYVQRELSARRQ